MKKSFIVAMFAALLLASSGVIHASSGGGGGGGGLYSKLGTFTVNLKNISQFLQVDISLKLPNAEMLEQIKSNFPIIRHELILLLSTQDSAAIAPATGRQKLMEECRDTVNKAMKLRPEDGIKEVLFESFVIQQ